MPRSRPRSTRWGFNPCCSGSLSPTRRIRRTSVARYRVSILVVLDHSLRHHISPRTQAGTPGVSILVVLDHSLRRRGRRDCGPVERVSILVVLDHSLRQQSRWRHPDLVAPFQSLLFWITLSDGFFGVNHDCNGIFLRFSFAHFRSKLAPYPPSSAIFTPPVHAKCYRHNLLISPQHTAAATQRQVKFPPENPPGRSLHAHVAITAVAASLLVLRRLWIMPATDYPRISPNPRTASARSSSVCGTSTSLCFERM